MATPSSIERALHHPQSVVEMPEAVVQCEQLSREHKRGRSWRQLIGALPPREGKMAGEQGLPPRPGTLGR